MASAKGELLFDRDEIHVQEDECESKKCAGGETCEPASSHNYHNAFDSHQFRTSSIIRGSREGVV